MLSLFKPRARHSDGKVFVVAEIGKNFIQTQKERPLNEYLRNALALIDAAADAGVDAVKFQTHTLADEQLPIRIVSPHFKGAERYEWIRRNEAATPMSFWRAIKRRAEERGVLFFSTPMSRGAAEKLSRVGVPLWKVGSGDATDFLLLEYLCRTKKPIIISTGMVSYQELDNVVAFLTRRRARFAILYCVSEYPAPARAFNLGSIDALRARYPGVHIGFSDHSVGNHDIPLAAAKLGARIIEKHFSLSRDFWGSDHKVSLTPSEMKDLVARLRAGEHTRAPTKAYYGRKNTELAGATNRFRPYFHKALVAARRIPHGARFTHDMLYAMRPLALAGGIPSAHVHEVLGRRASRTLRKYEPIKEDAYV